MKRIGKWLVFLLLAVVFCGCSEEATEDIIDVRMYDEDDYKDKEFVLETEDLLFELDADTTYFTLTQKSTGKVWRAVPEDGASDALADGTAKKYLQSTLLVKYSSESAVTKTISNYEYSISTNHYEIEKVEGGENGDEIRVRYTIGDVQKTYMVPKVITETRWNTFFDQMERAEQKKVERSFRKYDINNLYPTDDKAQLLEDYPELANEKVYVLYADTKAHMLQTMEDIFASVGYTQEDYLIDLERYTGTTEEKKPMVNVTMVYRLEDNRLEVEIPHEEIEYREAYPLVELSVLPYFGAGSLEDTGYILVPEGSGAVMEFNNGKSDQSAYAAEVYGWDYDQKRDAVVNETRAAMPVFGIANGDSSFVSIIESYSTIATIQADVSGRRSSYNNAYASYEIIHGDSMDVSAKSNRSIMSFEKNPPEGSTVQSFTFIDSTDYADMAKVYRAYMQKKYPELVEVTEEDMPVAVELLGAIDRVKQIAGMPVKSTEVLTSFTDAQEIMEEMLADGYANLVVRYTGWMNGGVTHSIPKDVDLVRGMGGKKALKSLLAFAESNGIDIYLSGRVENAYDSDVFDGFIKSRDAAKYVSREVAELSVFSNIAFGEMTTDRWDTYYLLRPSVCVKLMDSLAAEAAAYGAGVGFEDIGYLLSADYNPRRAVTREESMKMQQEALAKIKASGTQVMLTAGNEYAVAYADVITDVDLTGKSYNILDYTVPFYEIALHGLVNYTGKSINLSGNAWESVLKAAETGAGLYFTFMAETGDILQNTEYMDYFGADYSQWKAQAKEYVLRYEEEMKGLNNQDIVGHQVLAKGVTATTYEDGTVVYVNYTDSVYTDGTLSVPAKDYMVERSAK